MTDERAPGHRDGRVGMGGDEMDEPGSWTWVVAK